MSKVSRSLSEFSPRRAAAATIGAFLLAVAASGTVWAESMPADARVWMVHESNACWDHVTVGGSSLCAASDQFGAAGGIPMQTYDYSGNWVTSFAQAFPDSVHTYLAGISASFMYVSMHDTYTVHGNATEPFAITARLTVDGVANSIFYLGNYWLYRPSAYAEIGTFNPTIDPLLEQFRVTPFYAGFPGETTAKWEYLFTIGPYVTVPFEVSTAYTKTVQAGDIFELGYGVNTHLLTGELDLRNTALVSFDLPEGVWLTSQNGAVFGSPPTAVPEPSSALLFATCLLGLGFWGRKRLAGRS